EIRTRATHRPEKIRILLSARCVNPGVRGYYFDPGNTVASVAEPGRERAFSSAERIARDSHRWTRSERDCQLERLGEIVQLAGDHARFDCSRFARGIDLGPLHGRE